MNGTTQPERALQGVLERLLHAVELHYPIPLPGFHRDHVQVDLHARFGSYRHVVLEYDGSYWHRGRDSAATDELKTRALLGAGYLVVRVRDDCGALPIHEPGLLQICVTAGRTLDAALASAIGDAVYSWLAARAFREPVGVSELATARRAVPATPKPSFRDGDTRVRWIPRKPSDNMEYGEKQRHQH